MLVHPYIVFYTIRGNTIWVMRIIHGKRNDRQRI